MSNTPSIVSINDDLLFSSSADSVTQSPEQRKRKRSVIMIEVGPAEVHQLTLKRNKDKRYDWRKSVAGLRTPKSPSLK